MINLARASKIKLLFIKHDTDHRLIEVDSKALILSLWIIPIFTSLFILSLGILSIKFYQKVSNIKETSNLSVLELKEQNDGLLAENRNYKDQIVELSTKLQVPNDGLNPLQLFATTKGFKDLVSQNLVSVENLSYAIKNNVLEMKFELHNQSNNERMMGNFFVFIYAQSQILLFPNLSDVSSEINFAQGESYNIGRFKNVIFQTPLNSAQGKIKSRIIAFNRTGDLLLNKFIDLE
jgi:hypothetical protein